MEVRVSRLEIGSLFSQEPPPACILNDVKHEQKVSESMQTCSEKRSCVATHHRLCGMCYRIRRLSFLRDPNASVTMEHAASAV